ncbi:FkbM family methyltransferase [Schwartzia succinivorans]|jgi:FkbM family methyltransferase|uniref:Methyltransferase, FkbM family n=1 Tax=Schwartzia succinivorans DSM 10502 TaxID=1123243 RepID=A0A1M4SMV2_9FIRM|nr:FkbM family methyltransferase [Schwartzia succinivorans]SHE33297.1 methyltransferase, FkbM family [Schwartzia succinivorans DSM 10502]
MKTILYGCGRNLEKFFAEYTLGHDVVAIVDRNEDKHGIYKGINVIGLEQLSKLEFDKLLVTIDDYTVCLNDLAKLNIPNEKINIPYRGGHMWKDVKIVPLYGGGLKCDFDGVKFLVKNKSDLGVMNSIFVYNSWDFYINKKCTVIDIGMNIGLASLFFANMNIVDEVYGYEPFPMTYEDALNNFKLNPTISRKIQALNYGLSDIDSTLTCLYNPEYTTNMRTDNEKRKHGFNEISVNIQLKDSYEVLKDILNTDKITVLKLDCEGAEYSIMRRLDESGLLAKIDMILAETHDGKENMLKEILKDNNFIYFDNYAGDYEQLGFLYAVKNR